jgi:hypothetical protein
MVYTKEYASFLAAISLLYQLFSYYVRSDITVK